MTTEGLRERKKRETRARIEAVAMALFERDGFDSTTIESITAAADISPRTFFNYFPTKEDVVLADYADRLARITAALAERPAAERPWTALRNAFLSVAVDYQDARPGLVPRFRLMATNPSVFDRGLHLQADWETAIAAALADRPGVEGDQLTSLLMATAGVAAMRASLRYWLSTGATHALPDVLALCFDQLAGGLRHSAPGDTAD